MKLYIQELPAPRLFLAVPEAQLLVLKSTPAPDLYLGEAKHDVGVASQKSFDPLYLDLFKAGNPNREPVMGQFIGGGKGKAHGEGQEDLSDHMDALLNMMPGEDLEKEDTAKAKYTKREGSPGSYKYTYGEGDGGAGSEDKEKPQSDTMAALRAIGEYFKPLTQASSYKQVPGEIAGAARAAGRYVTGRD